MGSILRLIFIVLLIAQTTEVANATGGGVR